MLKHRMLLFFKVTSTILISLMLQSCTPEASWTAEDMENIEHLYRSQEADLAAIDISNRLGLSNFSKTEALEYYFQMLEYQKIALQEAELIKDSVLDKAHPELREHFRNEYQKSIELQLKRNDPTIQFDDIVAAGIMGAKLHNQWVDWFNAHKHEIKIPKKR